MTPCGEGEHLWLAIEKTGLTTTRAARWLAEAANVKPRDVGFSGLKDRRAVTRQWFSLPWPIRRGAEALTPDGAALPPTGNIRILEQHRHTRKLRRGTHRHNAFELTLRDVSGPCADIEADLSRIARTGAPNYFGPQRFGHRGHNLELARALFAGKRLRRDKRGYALSAARSHVFNGLLDARVRTATWNRIIPGEAVMLDGSRSVFSADGQDTAALNERLTTFDIHPSGVLPGQGGPAVAAADALRLEQAVLSEHGDLVDGLIAAGVQADRRALRLAVRDFTWHWPAEHCLRLKFTLPAGGFATSVLREVAAVSQPHAPASG